MKLKKLNEIKSHNLTLIYGTNGTGKTSIISSMPGRVLIIDTDNGLESVEELDKGSAVAQCETFDDVCEALNLWEDYDSIVIDTIDKVQELAIAQVMSKDGKVYGTDLVQLNHYGGATSTMMPLINNLVSVAKEGKNVLVLGHEKSVDPDTDDPNLHQTITVALMPKIGTFLMSQCRIVGYAFKDFKETFKDGKKTVSEVYKGQFGGNPRLTTKVTRKASVKAPNVMTNITWEKLQMLVTGIKTKEEEK